MWSSVKISEELPQWQRWIPPILGPVLTHAETRLLRAEVHRSFITNMPQAMCHFMDIVSWISWISWIWFSNDEDDEYDSHMIHTLLSCDGQDCCDRWTIQLVLQIILAGGPIGAYLRISHTALSMTAPHISRKGYTLKELALVRLMIVVFVHGVSMCPGISTTKLVRIEHHPVSCTFNFGNTPIYFAFHHTRPCFESVLRDKINAYRYGQSPDSSA